jgi:drug/metabolite transporter (DMT)-like permease
MIQRHPGRVLLVLLVLAGVFLTLGGPGRNATSGAWMYVSGLSFIAFLITVAALVVLAGYLLAARRRAARSEGEHRATQPPGTPQ